MPLLLARTPVDFEGLAFRAWILRSDGLHGEIRETGTPEGCLPDPIVEEELALLAQVNQALAATDERPAPSEENLIEELEHIRDQLVRGGPDFFDQSALATRWSVQSALLAQLRRSRSAPEVDPGSPYFAHMRLREGGRVRDVCLGRATRLDNGLRIVDWRHAPIAQLFYRYQQGDAYEEEISGRVQRGRDRGAPRRHDPRAARSSASRRPRASSTRTPAPRRLAARGAPRDRGSRAARAPRCACTRRATAGARRLGTDPAGARGAPTSACPTSPGLIDPEQFALIARPVVGLRRDPRRGGLGQDHRRAPPHRLPRLRGARVRLAGDAVRGVLAGAARLREPRAAGARRRGRRRCAPSTSGRPSSAAGCCPRCPTGCARTRPRWCSA